MKTKNWPNAVIALIVIACSLVLLAALTIALGRYDLEKGNRTAEIEFSDATGIKLHSPVRYAGASAGTVTRLRYLTPEERRQSKNPNAVVRVTIRFDHGGPPIPSDVSAGLSSETILGEKFIALSGGTQEAPPLTTGSILQAKESIGFDSLASSAREAIENVNHILTRLNGDYPQLIPRLGDLLAQGNSLLAQGSNFIGSASDTMTNATGLVRNANGLVTKFRDDTTEAMAKLNALLSQARGIATNTDSAILRVDSLIQNNEQSLHQILEELKVVTQNLKVMTTYTKSLTGTLAEKPSRLIWSRKENQLPTEQEILESSKPISTEPTRK